MVWSAQQQGSNHARYQPAVKRRTGNGKLLQQAESRLGQERLELERLQAKAEQLAQRLQSLGVDPDPPTDRRGD